MGAIKARPFALLCVLTLLNAGYVLWPSGIDGPVGLRVLVFVGLEELLVLLVASFCVTGEPTNAFQRFLKRADDLFQSVHHGRLHRPVHYVAMAVLGVPFLVLLALSLSWMIWA